MRLARGTALLLMAVLLTGCGARWAYRQGQTEAKRGNWDLAVARLTRALQKDPDNIRYRIALEKARVEASRAHAATARRHLAAGALDKAVEELQVAANFDPANEAVAGELQNLRRRIQAREEEKRRLSDFSTMKSRAQAYSPMPVLSPRSTAPITLSFPNQSLEKVFEALGKIAGINILFDPDFRDKQVRVNLTGVSFQEALDQLTLAHRMFYKVLDRNTIIIVPESQAKRRVYDDVLLRTFYIQNADVKEVEALVKTTLGAQPKVASNPSLGAINVVGTPDELAVAERVIEANDKPRGEVVVQVEIMEVNRERLKDYGIALSNYTAAVTLAPTGAEGELDEGLTNVRAHLLSSLNLSDFVVSIPSSLLTSFFQSDGSVKILAAPRLRAAEGKKTSLKIGTEVPVPVTTFQAVSPNPQQPNSFSPATSFQYRNVGVNLELTPRVSAGGDIALELSAEFSLLGTAATVAGQELPTFLTRTVNGVLRVRDGETILVGGLLQERETEALSGLLGLQSVPVLNKVFTNTVKRKEQTEILISLTPHLMRAPLIDEVDLRAMLIGTRETIRVAGTRPPLFGTEEEGTVETSPTTTPSPSPSPSPAGSPQPPPGPSIGRPPGTVSPSLPPAGAETTPANPSPAPQAVPTPIPPPGAEVTPLPGASPSPSPGPTPGPTPEASEPIRPAGAGISPPQVRMRVGETSDVAVVVTNARDLSQVEVVLSYDPVVLEAVDVRPGTLLTLDGAAVNVEQRGERGRMHAILRRPSGVSGSGMAVAVTFRGLAAGSAAVRVESLVLVTAAGTQGPPVGEATQVTVLP
jgi:general secretion pathway protein D